MFAFISEVQLALDSLDRLVETLEERGPLSASDAARALFATSSISDGLACSLLAEVTAGDSRIACAGATVSLAGTQPDPLLEEAELVVFDLETTGLSAARDRICELGAVRVQALELVDSFQSLVNPRVALPEPVARLTGLREQELRGRAFDRQRPRPLPRLRRRFAPRRAQRALRPAVPRAAAARSCTIGACPSRRSARPPSLADCSKGACAASASPRSRTSSAFRPRRATAPCPTPRRRRRCSCT